MSSNRVPTTFEMDGLYTEEDKKNRFSVVFQCRNCRKWVKHTDYLINREYVPCSCGEISYDQSSMKSVRTHNPLTDNKRKPK